MQGLDVVVVGVGGFGEEGVVEPVVDGSSLRGLVEPVVGVPLVGVEVVVTGLLDDVEWVLLGPEPCPAPVGLSSVTVVSVVEVVSPPATPEVLDGISTMVMCSLLSACSEAEPRPTSTAAVPQPMTTATITAITRQRDREGGGGGTCAQPSRASNSETDTSCFTRSPFQPTGHRCCGRNTPFYRKTPVLGSS
ncbi:hypothetical protein SAMN05421504_102566 [Amycolatopsis xylanica]|uniref:Uncharacterized protein n=1 Tax=Amycolatopsis xylanica TaxID=589385 RepID=A0A1H2ZKL4_9PSEU|nr:hypothetical protein SAMN05421504_102566 [Amycolatopsis xylanica]